MGLDATVDDLRVKFALMTLHIQSVHDHLKAEVSADESMLEHMHKSLVVLKKTASNLRNARDRSIVERDRSCSQSRVGSGEISRLGSTQAFMSKKSILPSAPDFARPYSLATQKGTNLNSPKLESLQAKLADLRARLDPPNSSNNHQQPTIVIQNNIRKLNYTLQTQNSGTSKDLGGGESLKGLFKKISTPSKVYRELKSTRLISTVLQDHSRLQDTPTDGFSPSTENCLQRKKTSIVEPRKDIKEKLMQRLQSIRSETHVHRKTGSEACKLVENNFFKEVESSQLGDAIRKQSSRKVKSNKLQPRVARMVGQMSVPQSAVSSKPSDMRVSALELQMEAANYRK